MADLDFERHPTLSHSELTSGHDVSQLLSQINQNFKQSKADQILRLLHDQDKLNEQLNDSEIVEKEYNQIREEKVICDSDTLTDSSSDEAGEDIVSVVDQEDETENIQSETRVRYKSARCRTSMGFRDTDGAEKDPSEMDAQDRLFDTRDITLRPKSSYVRRSAYRRRGEQDAGKEVANGVSDEFIETNNHRLAKSAKATRPRPPSRLGRSSVERTERKIALVEANDVTVVPSEQPVVPTREELVTGANRSYDRFARLRTPKRESNRTKHQFCTVAGNSNEQTEENMSVDDASGGSNSIDAREDITVIQPIPPTHSFRSSFQNNVNGQEFLNTGMAPRNAPNQTHSNHKLQYAPSKQDTTQPTYQELHADHSNHNSQYIQERTEAFNPVVPNRAEAGSIRSDPHAMRQEHGVSNGNASLKRTDSNISNSRPRNPEPIQSRPMDGRPTTRRRLQRRFMAQTQKPIGNVRPTSESVILARQKTEKMMLMKKQQENRPHSEKIVISSTNKNILSVNENPAQGPQTMLTSKSGIQQASHVQASGFRGYGQGSRLTSSTRKREIKGDLSLPRPGPQNNVMLNGRKSLAALMKLPPLEASLAAKKKERGLALAARETCV